MLTPGVQVDGLYLTRYTATDEMVRLGVVIQQHSGIGTAPPLPHPIKIRDRAAKLILLAFRRGNNEAWGLLIKQSAGQKERLRTEMRNLQRRKAGCEVRGYGGYYIEREPMEKYKEAVDSSFSKSTENHTHLQRPRKVLLTQSNKHQPCCAHLLKWLDSRTILHYGLRIHNLRH